jgi:hypothetical protein
MSNRGNGKPAEEKQEALKQLILLSGANDSSTWPQVCQFFHPQQL